MRSEFFPEQMESYAMENFIQGHVFQTVEETSDDTPVEAANKHR